MQLLYILNIPWSFIYIHLDFTLLADIFIPFFIIINCRLLSPQETEIVQPFSCLYKCMYQKYNVTSTDRLQKNKNLCENLFLWPLASLRENSADLCWWLASKNIQPLLASPLFFIHGFCYLSFWQGIFFDADTPFRPAFPVCSNIAESESPPVTRRIRIWLRQYGSARYPSPSWQREIPRA